MPKIAYEQKKFRADSLRTIEQAESIIVDYQAQGFNLTLRQLYYQFVARGLIPNTEKSYTRIGNIISDARRAGLIDWDAIEDRTRFMRDLPSWDKPQDILESARQSYHRDLWANQPVRIEAWIEKDALVGVIEGVCDEFDVPYLSCRGYVSDSEMWHQSQRILSHKAKGQATLIFSMSDHDPSGVDMTVDIGKRLSLFTGGGDCVYVKRIALTMQQIQELHPPPNPAKKTDSRWRAYAKAYGPESWELDALSPAYFDSLLRREILTYRDPDKYEDFYRRQETERGQIDRVSQSWHDCLVCGTSFNYKRGDSRYCSDRCRQSAYRQRALRVGVTGKVTA
ncbi:MAG: hypothetical protein HYX90_01135 [Chloroflexi bacterium]|nr:hypothetical protein [Chloroflexota bacterium]